MITNDLDPLLHRPALKREKIQLESVREKRGWEGGLVEYLSSLNLTLVIYFNYFCRICVVVKHIQLMTYELQLIFKQGGTRTTSG